MMADSSISRPYITISLHAAQDELNLSGKQAFDFQVTATLHADKALVIYISDTLLPPDVALREGGIELIPEGEDEPLLQSVLHISTLGGSRRGWNAENFTVMEPEVPKSFQAPFGALRPLESDQFDVRFWISTAGLETGKTYEARLPSAKRVTWWRVATAAEVDSGAIGPPGSLTKMTSAAARWWNNSRFDEGVPVLPEAEQLSLSVSGNGVRFTCIGTPAHPPKNS
jgi:hypothetical protein